MGGYADISLWVAAGYVGMVHFLYGSYFSMRFSENEAARLWIDSDEYANSFHAACQRVFVFRLMFRSIPDVLPSKTRIHMLLLKGVAYILIVNAFIAAVIL